MTADCDEFPQRDARSQLVPGPLLPEVEDPARRRRRRWLVRIWVVLGVLLGMAAFHRPLLAGFAGLFRVDDPAPSDALVVLLGGPTNRPQHAAKLYRQGLAPQILIGTSTDDAHARLNETQLAIEDMTALGVPRSAIHVLPRKMTSTRDEARDVADYAASHDMRRITVVTTSFHTARARWIFRRLLRGRGVEVRMAAAPHPEFDERTWYRRDEGLVIYFSEAIKSVYYWVMYR